MNISARNIKLLRSKNSAIDKASNLFLTLYSVKKIKLRLQNILKVRTN